MTEKQSGLSDEDQLFEELAKGYIEYNKDLFKDGIEPNLQSMAQIFKLIREFSRESDRACVIIAAIMLENALTKLLKDRLIASPSKSDALFDGPNAPLGSFSAKINLAYRMGLIPSTFFEGLELIRRVRNDFAHSISDAQFENPSVKQRITALVASQGTVADNQELLKVFPGGVRGEFLMTVSWMLWRLSSLKVSSFALPIEASWGYFFIE